MKKLTSFLISLLFSLSIVVNVSAQSSETIWISANQTSYKTGETVTFNFNGISATPIQGFTFQVRYDPSCLKPLNAASPIVGMNGLLLPQDAGLVDASFASTTPQVANGILAEIRFTALAGCNTSISLESASLAIKNESGFAAPLEGVTTGEKVVAYSISPEKGSAQDAPLLGTPLSLDTEPVNSSSQGVIVALVVIGFILIIGIFILVRILRRSDS